MQTLSQVKQEMYQNLKDRYNDFLSEEERYIVENLHSVEDPEYDTVQYTEDKAADIVFQCLDWIDATDTENAFWEAWYVRWYEVALRELLHSLQTEYSNVENINDVAWHIDYLLTD